ncbi:MAG: MFS transporter [Pseudomonadota bacterium]
MRIRPPINGIGTGLPGDKGRISRRFPNSGPLVVLVITLLIQAMAVAAVMAPTIIAPVLTLAFRLPDSAIGIYISLTYFGAIFSALYSGALIKKWGAIRVSQIGLLLCGSGLFLVSTGVVWLGAMGAVLAGLGYGPITPASSDILIRTTPAHRLSIVFSIKQTGVPLGGAFAGLLVPPQEIAFGWTWALISISVACVIMSLVAQCVRRELDSEPRVGPSQSFIAAIVNPIRMVLTHRNLLILTLCSFVFCGVQFSVFTFLPTYLNRYMGWTLLAAGVGVSVTQMAGMGGRLMWGVLADHGFGARRTMALISALIALSCLSIALFSSNVPRVWVFAVLIMLGASAAGWNGVFLAEVARLAPKGQAGAATGGTLAFTYFGVVFWPPLFGIAAQAMGSYQISYLAYCLPLLVCLVLLIRGVRPSST